MPYSVNQNYNIKKEKYEQKYAAFLSHLGSDKLKLLHHWILLHTPIQNLAVNIHSPTQNVYCQRL
jgi:hypothetical protein